MIIQGAGGHSSQLSELLRREQAQLQGEIAAIDRELVEMRDRRLQKEKRLELVEGLLGVEQGTPARPQRESAGQNTSASTAYILQMAEAVLRERKGEPMHYRELAEELLRRGVVIGGKDPAGGLVSRMSQDERFIRPTSKGFYGLREDHPTVKRSVGTRRRKRRRD
ncbi:MAG: winged helix-turn-helix domain-containing protein [Chloroflexi bacterium]|nr:winged helix-turn-helix domain-containing protein [Chloroflexota bacterium]